jgi:hypothetical protein
MEADDVCKCWAAGAEQTHGHERAMLECDVPSNGTRRRSSDGKLLREMQERGSRIENAAKVFDEMLTAGEVKLSLRSGSGSRMRAAETSACPAAGRGGAVARRAGRRRAAHDGFQLGELRPRPS